MDKRPLGDSDIAVSPLAFGGNVFGWTLDEKGTFDMLDAFTDAGFNFIDTADTYSRWVPGNRGGESEALIGKWMRQRGNRSRVVIATKVGGDTGQGKKDLSPKYIRAAVERSLRRLQTDYIDLYQSHYDDPDTPAGETLAAFAALVKEGKVRLIGASNFSPDRLQESLRVSENEGYPVYQTLQPLYNLYDREPFEKELQPLCLQYGIDVIPYYSLASGFLSGKYRIDLDVSQSPRGEGIRRKYMNERGFRILKALDEVAGRCHASAAAVAIAWLLSRKTVLAPIASATSRSQLQALNGGARLKPDADSLALLTAASDWRE
jgi:aryl-alcohol dehydrogenase-like predicted oxidoreductase